MPASGCAGLNADQEDDSSRPDMTQSGLPILTLPQPYLLFLGDITEAEYAKTAFGLRDWARERCVAEYSCPGATVTTGLPFLTPAEDATNGAQALIIGVANEGGFIADTWVPALLSALEAGLDIISGMHTRLADVPALQAAAERNNRRLIDVRRPPQNIPIATGRKRTGKRLLTVGTDCAIGKKYTALALTRAFLARGIATHFRATGQTGILIAGSGIPIDAVVADFAAGAAETLSPDAADDHWDIIEGQGSLLHPAYSSVSLALLHGSQPDVVVICHEPGRDRILGVPGYSLPTVDEMMELALRLGRRTNPSIRCAGVSLNTAHLDADSAERLLAKESERLRLAVADLGILVDQKKIDWDDKVIDHLPEFQMYDPWVTREMTIRDLLVHRSGLRLGEGDLLFVPRSNLSRAEVVKRVRYLKPATSFRSAYAYDNILYMVAGQLIESVTNETWEKFTEEHILKPAGMLHSTSDDLPRFANADRAYPHARMNGGLRGIGDQEVLNERDDLARNAAPAGGLAISANDFARWLLIQLGAGKQPDGDGRLFSEAAHEQMWKPVLLQPDRPRPPSLQPTQPMFYTYALGWDVQDIAAQK